MSFPREPVERLAQDFLAAWRAAHGFNAGCASALFGEDHLAILIEGAFSLAEHKLAENQVGETLLRHYAVELLNQISNQKLKYIQKAVGRKVCASDVSINPETDQVIFIFKLEVPQTRND